VTGDHPLEMDSADLRRLVEAALERICDHLDTLESQPAAHLEGGTDLARSLAEPLPTEGRPVDELLDLLFDRAIPRSYNTAGPGYLAYIPGGGILHSAVADLIADATNRYMGVFYAAPALAQLEANVVAWFSEIVGYPESARGLLTSGGSLANWTALVTARRERLPENFLDGAIYASDQTHHAVAKAALLAGFPAANVRRIATDSGFRIRLDALRHAVASDREAGLRPFCVTANAGTTNTGAVDPLDELADLAREEDLWLHVDAAYGGFFALTDRGRETMAGLDRADSVVLDPHKGLFLPYGTGALVVRDGDALRRAHTLGAEYLPPDQTDPDLVDFHHISPELSRPFRGLRVWLPVKMVGIGPFREALDEKLDLTFWAADRVREIEGMEILAEPQLSLFAFRWRPPGPEISDEELNRLNRELLDRVNDRRRVHLTGTMLHGRFALRICVLSFRTHRERMKLAVEDLRAAVREVAEGPPGGLAPVERAET
jgi:aromatic-L-amino-acid decarboxylase